MSSKNERESCLEDWLYDLKLTTRAERKKAMQINNIDTVEYFKHLIENKKHSYSRPKTIKTKIYE